MTTDADAIVILANSMDLLSAAIEHLAEKITPGGPQPASVPQPPGSPAGPPAGPPGGSNGGEKTLQQKMAGKVYALCKKNNVDMADAMWRAAGRDMGGDSRKLSEAELSEVLDGFKNWGWS